MVIVKRDKHIFAKYRAKAAIQPIKLLSLALFVWMLAVFKSLNDFYRKNLRGFVEKFEMKSLISTCIRYIRSAFGMNSEAVPFDVRLMIMMIELRRKLCEFPARICIFERVRAMKLFPKIIPYFHQFKLLILKYY